MNKRKNFMPKNRQPLQPYSEEREKRLEQIRLRTFRIILGNPNLSVQEMREMNNRKQEENTIEVTFLKHNPRSEEHTSELQSRGQLVCRLLLEKKKKREDS